MCVVVLVAECEVRVKRAGSEEGKSLNAEEEWEGQVALEPAMVQNVENLHEKQKI